jgi:hypothetical protein
MVTPSARRTAVRIALVLLAPLPMQLAIETGIAYLFLPRQYSAIVDSQHDLHNPQIREILAEDISAKTDHLLLT